MNKFEAALKKYVDIFLNQEMYFVNDLKNMELFQQIPLNINEADVRSKLSAMNDTDISHHALMEDAIKHIISLKVDDRIKRGDLSVVEDISNISGQAKTFHFLHFASAFCNFHRPDVFPIYSEQHFDFYRRYIKENNLPLDPEKLNTYADFSDRKSTRLNSSHVEISYAVFCLKKKKKKTK